MPMSRLSTASRFVAYLLLEGYELDTAVAAVGERVDAEREQTGGDDPEEERAVGGVADLSQGTVGADGLIGVVVDRGHDKEDTDEAEDDHAREVADGADPLDLPATAGLISSVFESERKSLLTARQPGRARRRRAPRPRSQPATCRRASRGRHPLRSSRCPTRRRRAGSRRRAHRGRSTRRRGHAVEPAVGPFRPMAEQRADEPPQGVAGEACRDQSQEDLSEGLRRDRLQRALLARIRVAVADGELDREDPDDDVDGAASDEAGARHPFVAAAPCDVLTGASGAPHGLRLDRHVRHRSAYEPSRGLRGYAVTRRLLRSLVLQQPFEANKGGFMGIGVSMILIAVGAVLAFAVHVTTSGFNVHTVGYILLVVGIVGVLISLVFWSSWGGFGGRTVIAEGPGTRRRTIVEDEVR